MYERTRQALMLRRNASEARKARRQRHRAGGRQDGGASDGKQRWQPKHDSLQMYSVRPSLVGTPSPCMILHEVNIMSLSCSLQTCLWS